jgi:hypothetical protein
MPPTVPNVFMRARVMVERVAGMMGTVVGMERASESVKTSWWLSEKLKGKPRRDATDLCHMRPNDAKLNPRVTYAC